MRFGNAYNPSNLFPSESFRAKLQRTFGDCFTLRFMICNCGGLYFRFSPLDFVDHFWRGIVPIRLRTKTALDCSTSLFEISEMSHFRLHKKRQAYQRRRQHLRRKHMIWLCFNHDPRETTWALCQRGAKILGVDAKTLMRNAASLGI